MEPGTAALPRRAVHCDEALAWLERQGRLEGCCLVTSLPDVSELPPLTLAQWREWFTGAAERVVRACPDDGVAIFYQTDIKRDGTWVDKAFLVHDGARRAGAELLWHKIVCRHPAGTVSFGRPGYAHLLCYAPRLRMDLARATADVIPGTGAMTWTRAMGLEACALACRFILGHTPCRTVVDPFCGHGSILAVANAMGLDAVGVELSRKRAKRARALRVAEVGGAWRVVHAAPTPDDEP